MNGVATAGPGVTDAIDIIDVLESRLADQRLCTQVAIELGVVLDEYLPAEGELIAAVAADVVGRWAALDGAGGRRPELFGPHGYVVSYMEAVEHDGQGRPHRIFCRRGDAVGGRLVDRRSYGMRVWRHHAEWLARITVPVPDLETLLAEEGGGWREPVTRMHQQSVVEWWRTRAGAALAPLVWESLGQDRDKVVVAVGDLFVDAYFSDVCYTRTPEGEELCRPEFMPDARPGEHPDTAAYEQVVWAAHVTDLVTTD